MPAGYIGPEWYFILLLVVVIAIGALRVIVAVKSRGAAGRPVLFAGPAKLDFSGSKCPSCASDLGAGRDNCPKCGWYLDRSSLPPRSDGRKVGVVQRDIRVSGVLAFQRGQVVSIEGEAPDAANPANRYIVESEVLKKKYLLSSEDVAS